jgi:hypothetical protein
MEETREEVLAPPDLAAMAAERSTEDALRLPSETGDRGAEASLFPPKLLEREGDETC